MGAQLRESGSCAPIHLLAFVCFFYKRSFIYIVLFYIYSLYFEAYSLRSLPRHFGAFPQSSRDFSFV